MDFKDLKAVYSDLSSITEESAESFGSAEKSFVIKALIGEGSFGSVYRCTPSSVSSESSDNLSGEGRVVDMAVKIISAGRISMLTRHSRSTILVRLLREVAILRRVGGHPNIVQLDSVFVSLESDRLFIVMELMAAGDLFSEVVRRRKPFSEREARQVVSQLVSAVLHCHRQGAAHRDIKLENVMVAGRDPFCIKLCDFGQAVVFENREAGTSKTLTTTSLYTPPEVAKANLANMPYNPFKVDDFNIGVVLYGILCVSLPDVAKGKNYEQHPNWCNLSDDAQDIVRGLLCPDPDNRLSLEDVFQHPWLSSESLASSEAGAARSGSAQPLNLEGEMQALEAVQALIKGLQKERGACCWALASNSGMMEYKWRCQSNSQRLSDARGKLVGLQHADWDVLTKTLDYVIDRRACMHTLTAGFMFSGASHKDADECFDQAFRGYNDMLQTVIEAIGNVVHALHINSSFGRTDRSIRIKLMLLICEQLGRERAFFAGNIDRLENLQSATMRLRFAEIQGSRKVLLGVSASNSRSDVVPLAGGLLPGLGLTQEPLFTNEELANLEEAELHVIEGKTGTSAWWSLITRFIDKVHSHISVCLVECIQELTTSFRSPVVIESSELTSPLPSSSMSMNYVCRVDTPDPYKVSLEGLSQPCTPGLPSVPEGVDIGVDKKPNTIAHKKPVALELVPLLPPGTASSDLADYIPEATPMFPSFHPDLVANGFDPNFMPVPCPPCNPPTMVSIPESDSNMGAPCNPPMMVSIPESDSHMDSRVVISVGTIGHPNNCSRLGCKYLRRRGCKDGISCRRCHLCIWTRSSDREGMNSSK